MPPTGPNKPTRVRLVCSEISISSKRPTSLSSVFPSLSSVFQSLPELHSNDPTSTSLVTLPRNPGAFLDCRSFPYLWGVVLGVLDLRRSLDLFQLHLRRGPEGLFLCRELKPEHFGTRFLGWFGRTGTLSPCYSIIYPRQNRRFTHTIK